MYGAEMMAIPRGRAEMWGILRSQFEAVLDVLWRADVDDKEDMIDCDHVDFSGRIKYRDDGGMRDQYLELGRSLLPAVHQALDEETLTPAFVQQWGMLMYCHGMVAAYLLDPTDPFRVQHLGREGGNKKRKDGQRRWLAHVLVPLIDHKIARHEAEETIAEWIATRAAGLYHAEDLAFIRAISTKDRLKSTYDEKHFSVLQMRKLIALGTDGLPRIPSQITR